MGHYKTTEPGNVIKYQITCCALPLHRFGIHHKNQQKHNLLIEGVYTDIPLVKFGRSEISIGNGMICSDIWHKYHK